MPTTKFNVVIAAIDQYSKVFQGLVKSVLSINQPIAQTNAQLKALTAGPGVKALNDDVKSLSNAFANTHDVVSSFLPQLAAIGSVAGIAAAIPRFASYAQGLYNVSIASDIATDKLQTLDLAAQRVGATEGAASQELLEFNSALNAARWGYNQELRNLLTGRGILFGTREKPEDTMKVFDQFLKKLDELREAGATKATLRGYIAETGFGGIEKLLLRPKAERDRLLAEAATQVPLTEADLAQADKEAKELSALGTRIVKHGGRIALGASYAIDDFFSPTGVGGILLGKMNYMYGGKPGGGGPQARAGFTPTVPASVAPLAPSEPVEKYLDRRAAADRRAFETDFQRLHPEIFAPTTLQRVRPKQELHVIVTFNGAVPPGTSATVEGSGVDATTHFGHWLPPIM
jgi:hypothetical protein